jgi:hypothetical protein
MDKTGKKQKSNQMRKNEGKVSSSKHNCLIYILSSIFNIVYIPSPPIKSVNSPAVALPQE